MKLRSIIFAGLCNAASLPLSVSAGAEPHPVPPSGLRPTHAEHADHREAAAEHRETEAQIRARVQQAQNQKVTQREAARKDARGWEASREQRAVQERTEVASNWGDIAEQPDAKAELATHAERMAQLNRILDVANDQHDAALTAHTNAVIQKEITRDVRVMQGIRARVGGK